MAITVTTEYYLNTYHGIAFQTADLTVYIARAQDMIDNIILVEPVGDWQTTHYKKAVCAQAESIGNAGGLSAFVAQSSGSSFTIGAFSMSGGASGAGAAHKNSSISELALGYLESAGLLARHCEVRPV